MFDPIKEQQKFFETWNATMKNGMMMPNYEEMQKKLMANFEEMQNNIAKFANVEEMKKFMPNVASFEDLQKFMSKFTNYEEMQKYMANFTDFEAMKENFAKFTNYEEMQKMYTEMQEKTMKMYENFLPGYEAYAKQFGDMFPKMDNYAKLFEVKVPGMEMYNKLYDFYKGLVNPADLVKDLQENYNKIMSAAIQNCIPNANIADLFKQPQDVIDTCVKFYQNMMQPWVKLDDELMQKVMNGDVNAYIDFFTEISDKYEETFGKVVKMMNMGINLEVADEQQKALDAYYKMMFAAGKLAAILVKNNNENAKVLTEKYQAMINEGQKVSTFKEYYDLWYNTNEAAMEALFATELFSKAFADFTDKYFLYMSASNAVLERNLSKLPIPTNKDMNSLYLTVYNLRKDVRDLKKAVEALQNAPAEAPKAE